MSSTLHRGSVLLVTFVFTVLSAEAGNVSCPAWFSFDNSTQQCECGALKPWGIRCNQQEMKFEVANGYCVTYMNGLLYAGDCEYTHSGNFTDRMYSEMPHDPDRLNEIMCGSYHRKGLLCGECIDGYGPAVYSPDKRCVDCSKFSVGHAVCLYLLLEFIPILLFFVFVMVFRLNITSGPLLGYVFFCQLYVLGIRKNVYIASNILSRVSDPVRLLIYSSLALCGVWNLKFSWIFIPPFCISSHLTGIHIELLELVPPIMTIVILAITCILIEIYKRNCSPIVLTWKIFCVCLKKLSLKPVDGSAVIHTFATFIFLSACNLNFVTIVTLTHDPVSHSDGSFYKLLVACDPTITWFSRRHFAYLSFMAVAFMFLVLIPSLLLCVYPTRIYCLLSQAISARKQLAIKTFAEALHPCFKDGLNGTRDYRALAGIGLVFSAIYSLISFYIYNLTKVGYDYQILSGIMLILLSTIFSYWRPCRSLLSNLSVSYHSMALGLITMTLSLWKQAMSFQTETLELIFITIPIMSHIFVLTWAGNLAVRQIIMRCKILQSLRASNVYKKLLLSIQFHK